MNSNIEDSPFDYQILSAYTVKFILALFKPINPIKSLIMRFVTKIFLEQTELLLCPPIDGSAIGMVISNNGCRDKLLFSLICQVWNLGVDGWFSCYTSELLWDLSLMLASSPCFILFSGRNCKSSDKKYFWKIEKLKAAKVSALCLFTGEQLLKLFVI